MQTLRDAHTGLELDELHVVTTGDRIQDRSLAEIGGKGLFIKEIEEAILDGRAALAVHSLKDVPAELAPALCLSCIPPREDPHDVLVSRSGQTFEELPSGSVIGTSSLRRQALLTAWRSDIETVPLRGNVDTRLRKCREGQVDAVVLAAAGLRRLGLQDQITQVLPAERCLPAVGQGALAIETRDDDEATRALLAAVNDEATMLTTRAERGVMAAVEGSCQLPVAAYALRDGDELWLRGFLAEPDGSRARSRELRDAWPTTPEAAWSVGHELGLQLKAG